MIAAAIAKTMAMFAGSKISDFILALNPYRVPPIQRLLQTGRRAANSFRSAENRHNGFRRKWLWRAMPARLCRYVTSIRQKGLMAISVKCKNRSTTGYERSPPPHIGPVRNDFVPQCHDLRQDSAPTSTAPRRHDRGLRREAASEGDFSRCCDQRPYAL